MIRKFFLFAVMLVALTATSQNKRDWDAPIPNDTCVLKGVLPNGLTYYIRHNAEPKERCNFYLVRRVGATCESDAQNGLAHFLEHMAFNGSANFPAGKLVDALKRHGISYGDDLNASTGIDQTVYHIAGANTTDASLIDTCLLVLRDWTSYLTLSDAEINKERGVILGEWREGNNANFRMSHKVDSAKYAGSIYAIRDVIGDTTLIKTFKPQTLRDFYRDWYRTSLEAVVIVGDIDAKAMEKRVRDMFGKIAAVKNPPVLPTFTIPSHADTHFVLATDKEATQSVLSVSHLFQEPKWEGKGYNTINEIRETMLLNLFNDVMQQRIYEKLQSNDVPFINAFVGIGSDVKHYYNYSVTAVAKQGEDEKALRAALEENRRVLEHGVTQTEVDRLIAEYKEGYASMLRDKEKTCTNGSYTSSLVDDFCNNNGYADLPDVIGAIMEILPTIKAEEVSAIARRYWTKDNRTIIVTGQSDVPHITEAAARKILDEVEGQSTVAYADNVSDSPLVTDALPGAKVVKTEQLPQFSAERWTLSNGAKVIYRFADYEKDEVQIDAQSPGGGSKITDLSLIPAYQSFEEFANYYGLGEFNDVDLTKKLSGTIVSTEVTINTLNEVVHCSTTPRDAETTMKLLYLTFVHPRFDATAHAAIAERRTAALIPTLTKPENIRNDKWTLIEFDNNPRTKAGLPTKDYYDRVTLERIEKIYRDRIRDAGDFTFFIVGNIQRDSAMMLAQKYIGSIPGGTRREKWDDVDARYVDHEVKESIVVPCENPAADTRVLYHAQMPYSVKDDYTMDVMSDILQTRCEQIIREEKGATYGVQCGGQARNIPYPRYSLGISFLAAPDSMAVMRQVVFDQIDKLLLSGVTQEEINMCTSSYLKDLESAKQHNSYWLNKLEMWDYCGINYDEPKNSTEILQKMDPTDILDFARRFFKAAKKVDVTFLPK